MLSCIRHAFGFYLSACLSLSVRTMLRAVNFVGLSAMSFKSPRLLRA